ncbi:hypothetical protein GRI36_04355 [Altererythrobacter gangjinensis]|uniref:DUF4129 domain-containing protein n=1 Tax=Pontixanthobacter gangjinensis TaxID=1028742 RepID=A0A6I4SK13_9SPHN|nr:hypothetical protein [Pontixanthobacter gangjinensis]
MTTGNAQIEPDGGGTSTSSYDAVRADDSIQYSPTGFEQPKPADPPSWLEDFLELLASLLEPIGKLFGGSWPIVKWVLIGVAIAMLLYLLWKLLAPVLEFGSKDNDSSAEDWIPEQGEAIALLDEADQLAARGDYDGATHLLLKRSVRQISDARPDWVEPSSTARELAILPALPQAARTAFGTIAGRVERSLFALNKLGVEDWEAARSAYAQFALQRLSGDGG